MHLSINLLRITLDYLVIPELPFQETFERVHRDAMVYHTARASSFVVSNLYMTRLKPVLHVSNGSVDLNGGVFCDISYHNKPVFPVLFANFCSQSCLSAILIRNNRSKYVQTYQKSKVRLLQLSPSSQHICPQGRHNRCVGPSLTSFERSVLAEIGGDEIAVLSALHFAALMYLPKRAQAGA